MLSDIASINPTSQELPNVFYYIDLESVVKGNLIKETVINKATAPSRAQRVAVPNDIFFQTVRPYQQNNYLFEKERNLPTVASTGYAQVRTCEVPYFLYELLHTKKFLDQALIRCTGSSYPAINGNDLCEIAINIPSHNEQQVIANFLRLLEKKINLQSKLIDSLKSYKRGAIARYFSEQTDNEKWTDITISNCLFYEQPQKYIVHSEHYSDEYKTPVLTANKAFILGYTNETDGIYDKGEVLIYDDFTMGVKYVNFPFKVKSSTIKMLTPKRNIDLYFIYNLLQYLELKPEGHQRSYISILEPMEIKIPCYEEQRQAAKLFRLLDNKIEQEQFILHKLLQLKSGLLQQLFI